MIVNCIQCHLNCTHIITALILPLPVDSKERPTVTELSFTYIMIFVVVLVVVLCALFASVNVNICFCVKYKQSKMASDIQQSLQPDHHTQPVYDIVTLSDGKTQIDLEMTENVAYGPIKLANVAK